MSAGWIAGGLVVLVLMLVGLLCWAADQVVGEED